MMSTKLLDFILFTVIASNCRKDTVVNQAVETGRQPFFVAGTDPKPAGKTWQEVSNMSDDFEGGTLDEKKWQKEPVGNYWNWIGRPPGLFKTDNVVVKDGKMNVTAGKLDASVKINDSKSTR